MPVIEMHRDGETASVDSAHLPTYVNFLAHGWKPAGDAEPAPAEAAPEAHTAPAEAEPATPPAPVKGRKAR